MEGGRCGQVEAESSGACPASGVSSGSGETAMEGSCGALHCSCPRHSQRPKALTGKCVRWMRRVGSAVVVVRVAEREAAQWYELSMDDVRFDDRAGSDCVVSSRTELRYESCCAVSVGGSSV